MKTMTKEFPAPKHPIQISQKEGTLAFSLVMLLNLWCAKEKLVIVECDRNDEVAKHNTINP